jgi:uncharacterized membrane protein
VLFALTLIAALGCALLGGIFFAFSNFVMKALAQVPAASGIAAMQAINRTVLNALFLALFFGTAAACASLLLVGWENALLLAGAALYLIGTFGVTIVFNVPRNKALARLEPSSSEPAWRRYRQEWTWWNHVRTLAAVAAAALLTLALSQLKT